MIRHVVLFKIKPEYKAEIPSMVEGFYEMMGKVDGLLELQAGADFLMSERSYDLGLVCLFRDRAAFSAYQEHPAHKPVRARMQKARETSVACDFEI